MKFQKLKLEKTLGVWKQRNSSGSCSYSGRFLPRYSGFLLLSKTNISSLIMNSRQGTTKWMYVLPMCYLSGCATYHCFHYFVSCGCKHRMVYHIIFWARNMHLILTKRVVKVAEYWPSLFWSRSIKTQKRTGPVSSHLNCTSLVNKGFIIWQKRGPFPAGPTREIPSGQGGSASQSEFRIRFILPAHGFSHLINYSTCLVWKNRNQH